MRYKCFRCETKFYDLKRPEPLCPSCGVNQKENEGRLVISKKTRRRKFSLVKTAPVLPEPMDNEILPDAVQKTAEDYPLDIDDIVMEGQEELYE
jgi:hypothetical protein